ncbi:unnamed protein product [Protopolystoma xenopodis]|uniref:Uncharacterized protein n=1 Tax=Protopolystoma xenopodis TaxID=117903 RepID=A0A448WGJ3_9PLAT|nr:unnamed protein product [Protopolystoma xenopodis]
MYSITFTKSPSSSPEVRQLGARVKTPTGSDLEVSETCRRLMRRKVATTEFEPASSGLVHPLRVQAILEKDAQV